MNVRIGDEFAPAFGDTAAPDTAIAVPSVMPPAPPA